MKKNNEQPMIQAGRTILDLSNKKRVPQKGVKLTRDGRVDVEYMRKKDNELVTGVFQFHECPGGKLSFPFHKYKGDPIEQYELYDGMTYTIPRMVANHINKDMRVPSYHYLPGEPGVQTGFSNNMEQQVKTWKARASFNTIDTLDDYDAGNDTDIAIVESKPK